jgi:hypothetical protein
MGKTRGPYVEEFPVGTSVRIVDRPALAAFSRSWRLHNPLQPEQLQYAGRTATVATVGFYHGGDELYELEGVPGVWHEVCLVRTSDG